MIISDPLFTRLFLLAEIHKFSPAEYKQYKKSLENMSELDNVISSTAEVAESRGRAEGVKETAKKMKERGISDDIISECTGLTIETIQSL